MSNPSNKLLSDITAFRTYSKYLKHLSRRETLSETINRNMTMHLDRFPKLSKDIVKAYQRVHDLKVMPSMRALDDNTIINTLNGWKLVGDVCVGDILYDSSGKETKVLEVYKFKDVDLYQVDFSDNTNLVACDEHKWIVSTQDDLGTKKQRVVDTMFLKQHLKRSGKNNISIKNPEPLMYTTKDLKIDPYILGHWLGDGYSVGYQFSASTEDSSFFIDEYNKYGYTVKQRTSSNIWTFFVHGLAKDLRVYDLLKNKHIPEIYLRGDLNQRLSLIQGLMDSDGHITDAGRCMFYNTNPRIVAGFCELLSSLGIKYTTINKLKKKEPHLDGKTVSFFTSLPVARLPRKYNNIRKYESTRTQRRYVTDVSFFKKGNASCFLVDSSDNSFLAGSRMIVTHNCLQFSGDAILKNNVRLFNCSAVAIDNPRVFAEILYVLLSGAGVGFSVQSHHVNALPKVRTPKEETRFLINDSIMGWAQSVEMLVNAYFFGGVRPLFDYSLIRPKGSYMVTTGAKAPGPAPLKFMLELVESKLKLALDRKLTPLECHDIVCIISDAVLAGGIRRSSLISLFDKDDKQMLTCKHGEWWNNAPWRARANNSAVLLRSENDRESFDNIFQMCRDSNAGEPGISFSNSLELLTNPCHEISLHSNQFCNLSTINQTGITNKRDFMNRVYAASLIGTLQASYTDFDYLSPRWKEITDKEALLGVSFTGIADNSGFITAELLSEGAKFAIEVNEKYASKIGINSAYRVTCLKPEGSASCVLSSSSGIHARHAEYYIRRIRMNADDALGVYLKSVMPDLVEADLFSSTGIVVSLPQESPKNSIIRSNESALDLFNRTMFYHDNWINPGHKSGLNKHNVSVTISLRDEEWDVLRDKMWKNRHRYTGISLLPYDGGNYQQAPFEEIDQQKYNEMIKLVKDVDLSKVIEDYDNTERTETLACVGGLCDIT